MTDIQTAFRGAFSSERLIYRSVEDNESDMDFIHARLIADPVIRGLSSRRLFQPVTGATTAMEVSEARKNCMLGLMICMPPNQSGTSHTSAESAKPTPIGILFLHNFTSDSTALWRRTSITIQIATEYQGKGYGSEAINWALDWSFKWAGLHKVEISATSLNERAAALYERLGFKLEGRQRHALYMNRGWHDLLQFGMLEDEWERLRDLE